MTDPNPSHLREGDLVKLTGHNWPEALLGALVTIETVDLLGRPRFTTEDGATFVADEGRGEGYTGWAVEKASAEDVAVKLIGLIPNDAIPSITPTERRTVLTTADGLIHGDREQDYGRPIDSFRRVAQAFNVVLEGAGHPPITPTTAAALLIALKLSRLSGGDYKLDTWVDLAGYAALGFEVNQQESAA